MIFGYIWSTCLINNKLEKTKRTTKVPIGWLTRVANNLYQSSTTNWDNAKEKELIWFDHQSINILPNNVTIYNLYVLKLNKQHVYTKTISNIHNI